MPNPPVPLFPSGEVEGFPVRLDNGLTLHPLWIGNMAARTVACPVQALCGANRPVGQFYDVLSVWHLWAGNVTGRPLDCGHYLPEEQAEQTLVELLTFLR